MTYALAVPHLAEGNDPGFGLRTRKLGRKTSLMRSYQESSVDHRGKRISP